jgi:hypothetical protein
MAGFWETYYEAQKRINQNQQDVYDAHKDPEVLKGIARTALDSATIAGVGGEIEAGIRAPFSDQTFQEIDSQINQEQAAFKENNPELYQGYSVAGMAPTIAVGAPAAVTRFVGGKVLPNVLAGTTFGGLGGFFSGTGQGETTEERVQTGKEEIAPMAVGTGVVTAAMMGAIKATPYIGKFLGNMASKLMNKPAAIQSVPYNELSAARAADPDAAIKGDKYTNLFEASNRKLKDEIYDE